MNLSILDPRFTYALTLPDELMLIYVGLLTVCLVVPGHGRLPGHSGLHSPSNRSNTT
uniref:Uncharacterized protein n=1 Tax=Picea glauca TaxID=3330 RepID=A0A101LWS0_PICGL|nr:hypothetical protein ABT39_MTgene1690 [Picea glauca]QHR86853.1 hypothetical protein Q903MT_gene860 [Picea sitchensis]